MGRMGYKKLDDMIGQTHLLKQKDIKYAKASDVNLSMLLNKTELFQNQDWMQRREKEAHSNGPVLDDDVLEDEQFQAAMKDPKTYERKI